MLLTKEVTMNLSYREGPIVMDVMQGDTGRALTVHFLLGETSWKIPADAQVFVQFECQDKTGGLFDSLSDGTCAYSVNGDALTIFLVPAVCAVPGCTKLQVTIFSGDAQISTFPVEVRVIPQVNAKAESGEYFNIQQWLNLPENKGMPGYTPVRGVDYYTEADQQDMVQRVMDALPNGDEVAY